MHNRLFIIAIMWVCSLQATAQADSLYEKHLFVSNGDTMPYRLLLPQSYDAQKKYPVLLFLHGAGESGNNNTSQLANCGQAFLRDSIRKNYPAIVVIPQCSRKDTWANASRKVDSAGKISRVFFTGGEPTRSMVMVQALLQKIMHDYNVNERQIYTGGLSMGGMGVFEIVRRNPTLFAAAFPICGGANPAIAGDLRNASWWVFHGAADGTVDPSFSKNMVAAMQLLNIPVQFTLYPNTGHNSWDKALAEPGLFAWLFSIKK